MYVSGVASAKQRTTAARSARRRTGRRSTRGSPAMKQTGGCKAGKVQREEEMKQLEKMFARVEAAGFGD